MFRLMNYKILLLLMLFAFTGQHAWAGGGGTDYWYFSNAKVETAPTGAGKVYAGDQNGAANPTNCVPAPHVFDGKSHKSQFPYKWYVNTIPTDSKKYKFLRWEDGNGNILSTDQNPEDPFMDNEGVKGGGNNTGKSGDGATNPGTVTVNYIAVYEEIINQYVSVESQNPQYLTATIDKPENEIGDDVTLWAYPNNYDSKFTGWSKDGEIVSMENPWTFTIDESNAGTYIATYKTGYNFYRFRNKETSRRFNAISDQGSITNFSSLQLVSGDVATYSAGSVVQISMHHISGGNVYDYIMQNSHTSAYYNESAGEYITMAINSVDNTWTINPNRQPVYMADENGANVSSSPYNNLDKSKWYIDPIDKDLETKENYFSLDPNKLVEVDGMYYTTLRTSWNILFNPEQMTPYIVKSVDETEGTFEMEPITGNIIPAGTPVIIETKSNDVEENRMVPTLTNAASDAVPSGNLLQHSEKYFPNQAAPVANCKGLYKNANGQLAFGGNALSTVNGNEAYLSVANEVVIKPEVSDITLAELIASGDTKKTYNVTDLTAVTFIDKANTKLIIAKDNNGYAAKDEPKGDNVIDYMKDVSELMKYGYDQSNWIGLRLPNGVQLSTGQIKNLLKHHLTGVVGKLVDAVNPEFQLTGLPKGDNENPVNTNTFITANFYGENTQKGTDNKTYFFVQPKPMEYAKIIWAQWDDEKEMFISPVHNAQHPTWNVFGLSGQFGFKRDYLTTALTAGEPASGHTYDMEEAIVKVKGAAQSQAPRRAEGSAAKYDVYPMSLTKTSTVQNGVITAVSDMRGKVAVEVARYSVTGMPVSRDYRGVVIVVMSDGTARKAIQ